jgi:hypothetical protein
MSWRACTAAVAAILAALAIAGHVGASTTPCEDGGPCTCGELYNLDRCSGIGVNTCGCGTGFMGPSLGETSDCTPSFGSNSCCLPTGQTYATACLGREDGNACTSSAQCASGACVNDVCTAGGASPSAAPAASMTGRIALLAAMLAFGVYRLRRRQTP